MDYQIQNLRDYNGKQIHCIKDYYSQEWEWFRDIPSEVLAIETGTFLDLDCDDFDEIILKNPLTKDVYFLSVEEIFEHFEFITIQELRKRKIDSLLNNTNK